jgi:hypothetical protein
MKRLICIICIGILMIIFTGCSNQIADTSAIKTGNNDVNSIEPTSSSSDYGTNREHLEVSSKNTKIYYPKLQGYKGELSMDYMNQSIKQIAESYAEAADYTDVRLDYEIKRIDEKVVSILFKGTAKHSGLREINIQKSINLDVKSTNPIVYENFIKNDERSRAEVLKLLNTKAKNAGITKGFEAEGVFIYFEGNNVVFFYMPLDDDVKAWVDLSVPVKELDGLINTEFGEHPAS